jgi:hypothetical protein
LALVGKLFPTTDPNHSEPLHTASFITQQDLAGDYTDYINDVELRNAPDTHAWRRGGGIPIFLVTNLFLRVDKQPRFASCQIAGLGKPKDESANAGLCAFGRARAARSKVKGFATKFNGGQVIPRRATLTPRIGATGRGSTQGTAAFQRRTFKNWRNIGKLTFDNAVASYNGDFVVHFNHPTWRENRNDPSTATRISGRKVR